VQVCVCVCVRAKMMYRETRSTVIRPCNKHQSNYMFISTFFIKNKDDLLLSEEREQKSLCTGKKFAAILQIKLLRYRNVKVNTNAISLSRETVDTRKTIKQQLNSIPYLVSE